MFLSYRATFDYFFGVFQLINHLQEQIIIVFRVEVIEKLVFEVFVYVV